MKNETHQKKYEQIRGNLMFMTRAKDDTLHALIALGKKMGPFRYLMIAVLFVFLFVYHASFHLFVQMKMRERFARAMAAAMSVVLIITSISIPAYAVENISDDGSQTVAQEPVLEEPEITYVNGFESLDEWITMQYVREGGSEEDIYFPDEITASVTVLSQENSEVPEDEENLNNPEDEENLNNPEDEENQGNPEDEENLNNPEDEENLNNPEDEENLNNPENEENLNNPEDEENPDEPENEDEENPDNMDDEENLNNPEDEENSDNPDDMASGLWKMTTVAVKMPVFYSEPDVVQMSTITEDMDIAVTWQLKGDMPFNAGTDRSKSDYEYEMVLPDGFELAEGVEAPVICVHIETPVKSIMPVAADEGYEQLKITNLNGNTIKTSSDTSAMLDAHAGFYDSSFADSKGFSGGAFPKDSLTINDVTYSLPSNYTGNDSIRLTKSAPTKTISLASRSAYDRIYILAVAGGIGSGNDALFNVTLYYTSGASTKTSLYLHDWFDGRDSSNKYAAVKRYQSSGVDGTTTGAPYLQQVYVDADQSRVLQSIEFQYAGSSAELCCAVYAVTGKFADGVPTQATTPPTAEDTISNAFTLNWSKVSNTTGYYIDVATDSSFVNMVDGYNNRKLSSSDYTEKDGAIVYTVGGEGTAITNETTYYFRVRPYNTSGSGPSSSTGNTKTKFDPLESPVFTYSVPSNFEQTVNWPHVENAGKYTWTLSRNGEELVSEQEIAVTQEIEESGVALNISDYLDDIGTYSLSVKASPIEDEKYRFEESESEWTMEFVFPQIESKTTGMPDGSGIGGTITSEMEDGCVTLTPVPDNSYSDFYYWETDNTNLAEGSQTEEYVLNAAGSYSNVTAYFGVYVEKIVVSYDETTDTYTLTLKDNIELEDALVFAEDENVVLDLNGKTMTTTTENKIVAQKSVLTIKNGNISSGSAGVPALSTEGDGAVIIENSAGIVGTVDGDAQVTWTEKDGSVHYATLADALGNDDKKAETGSDLTLIQDVVLEEDVTIPQDIEIKVPQGVELMVSEGCTLTNNGTLNTNGTLSNKGSIVNTTEAEWRNSGLVDNDGKITNNGDFDNNAGNIDNDGIIDGEGEIVNENGYIDTTGGAVSNSVDNGYKGEVKSEATWNENGETYFGSLKDATENASGKPQQQITITLQDDVTMQEDITVPDNAVLYIPSDTTLTVPEDITLDNDGNIVEAGNLDVEGTLDTQAEWTEGSTTHYGTLQEALDEVKDGETVTLLQDTDLTEELEDGESFIAPENAALVVPADVTLVLPKDVQVENEENIISDTVWADEEDKNYGSLESAVQDAAVKPEEDISIVLRDDVELDNDLTIPGNAHLQIPQDTTLFIPNGTTLDNNGNIEADGDLVVDDGGILDTEANWNEEGTEHYGTFNEALEALQNPEKDVDEIVIVGDVTLGEDVTIPENNSLIIKDNASLTVPEDTILDNKGTISNEGILNNDGTIQNDNSIDNKGIVDGDGTIANQNGNIDTDNGILQNKIQNEDGTEDGSNVESEASWTVVDENGETVTYYGSLSKALEAAEAGAEVTLYRDVVLDKNTTIKQGVTLIIPEGVELSVNPDVTLENNGTIKVNEGAQIINNGTIAGETGSIDNQGTINSENGNIENSVSNNGGTVDSPVSWTSNGKTYYGTLEGALADENVTEINFSDSVTLTENTTIPEDVKLTIPDGKELIVPEGITLTNNGIITNDGIIRNNGGIIANKGEVTGEGIINNNGTGLIDTTTGVFGVTVNNASTAKLEAEVSWEVDGKTYFGSLEEAIEAAGNTTEEVTIIVNSNPLAIEGNVTIPENMTLVIPDGSSLEISQSATLTNNGNVKIESGGKVDNNGTFVNGAQGTVANDGEIENAADAAMTNNGDFTNGGKITNNGSIGGTSGIQNEVGGIVDTTGGDIQTPIENNGGEISTEASWEDEYGNIQYGTLQEAIESGYSPITINGTPVELKADLTIPENMELIIPSNKELVIPEGKTLTNNGIITAQGNITTQGTGKLETEAAWKDDNGVHYGDLQDAIEAANKSDSSVKEIIVMDDVTLADESEDLIIPNGVDFVVEEDVSLTIPANGSVTVPEGSGFINKGTVTNEGSIVNKGTLDNIGTVTNKGTVDNNGELKNSGTVDGEGSIINDGSIVIDGGVIRNDITNADDAQTPENSATVKWTTNENGVEKTYYGDLETVLQNAKDGDTITLLQDESLAQDSNIPVGVTVVIPEGKELVIPNNSTLTNNGTIDNQGVLSNDGGTISNNGSVESTGSIVNKGGFILNNENGTIQNIGGTFANTNQGQISNIGEITSTNPISNNGNSTIDTTQGVLAGEVWNVDATGTLKAEVSWEVDGKKYYGSLEEAIDASTGTEEVIITLIGNPVIIDGNVTIPDNVTLEIPDDTALEVTGTLYNDGKIEVAADGKVKNEGTLINGEQAIIVNKGEIQNSANATLTNNGDLENEGTLTSNGVIAGNGEITNSGFVNLESGSNSNIIVNENPLFGSKGEVSSEATWVVDGKTYYGSLQEGIDAVETNGGTVTINRDSVTLSNDLTIPDGVELNVPKESVLIIPENIVFTNNGEIKAEGEVSGEVDSQVSWTDNKGITHFGTMDKLLEELESDGGNVESVTIIGNVTLPEKEEIIIPSHITVTIDENAELIVPSGTVLVNKGTIVNEGSVTNNGEISNEGAFNNEGIIENQIVENIGNGTSSGTVKSVTEDGKVYYSDLGTALENAEAGDTIVMNEDVEITENMTIPSGVTFEIPEDKTLIVAPGVVLENEGVVKNNGTIQNNGTLNNNCDFYNDGTINNAGTVVNKDEFINGAGAQTNNEGTFVNDDAANLLNNGYYNNNGIVDNIGSGTISGNNSIETSDVGRILSDVMWEITDEDGNTQTYYGSLEDGLAALKNASEGVLTLNRDVVSIEEDVTIPSNITLVVPENTELKVEEGKNLTNNGTIENSGIIQNNGDIIGGGNIANENGIVKSENGNIATNIENGENGAVFTEATWTVNGKTYYGTLEDALLATKSQLNSSITINNDLSIDSDIVIPSGVNVIIAPGVKISIESDASFTNNGTLTNNGEIECEGSFVNGSRLDGNGSISGETTWTDGSKICYGSLETAIEKAKEGSTITVLKNLAITDSVTLPDNVTLEVPANVTVTLKPGVEITGSVIGDGNVVEEKVPAPNPPASDDSDDDDDDDDDSSSSTGTVVTPEEELVPEETTEELLPEDADTGLAESEDDEEAEEEESLEEASSDEETQETKAEAEESSDENISDEAVDAEPDVVVIETPQEAEGVEVKKNTNVSMGEGEVIITAVSEEGRLSGELGNILKACFTEEELDSIQKGTNTEVRLTVVSLKKETNVTKKDKKAIEKAVSEYAGAVDGLELGGLYEIVIERKIGDGDWETLSELHEDIDVTIEIPEEIRKEGRTYFAIRNHEGECTILEDKDDAPYTITISTGLFSTYAITYTDAVVAADVDVTTLAPVSSAAPVWPWMLVIAVLAMGAITVIILKKRKEEAEEM